MWPGATAERRLAKTAQKRGLQARGRHRQQRDATQPGVWCAVMRAAGSASGLEGRGQKVGQIGRGQLPDVLVHYSSEISLT